MYFFLNISQMCLLLVKLWMIILTLFGRVTRMIKFVSPKKTNQINSSIHVMDTMYSDFPWHWLCFIQGFCTHIPGLIAQRRWLNETWTRRLKIRHYLSMSVPLMRTNLYARIMISPMSGRRNQEKNPKFYTNSLIFKLAYGHKLSAKFDFHPNIRRHTGIFAFNLFN